MEIFNVIKSFIINIDWANCIITVFAAAFGAWGAYRFNIRQENKSQKEIEKAQLIQLFYDLHILSKYILKNGLDSIKITDKKEYYELSSSINTNIINIDNFGFITSKSNKTYEILAHTKIETVTFIEQSIAFNDCLIKNKIASAIYHLKNVQILYPKLITMIYVSLLNINSMLIKYYRSKNLIEDIASKNIKKLSTFINRAKKNYEEIINNPKLIDKYTNKPYTIEEKEGYKKDLDYINYVLNEWILDFDLSKKEKNIIDKNIK